MAKFYATLDNNGPSICQDADILAFDRLVDAEKYLHDANPTEWPTTWLDEGMSVKIIEGDFGDCWIKTQKAPKVGDTILAPFNYNNVIVQAPGMHPGGYGYWLTPRPDILVANLVDETKYQGETHA